MTEQMYNRLQAIARILWPVVCSVKPS